MNKNKREQYGQRPDGSIRMKELPLSERPYEKCLRYGPEALSDSELLAVVIRTGSRGEKAVDLARKVLGSLPQKNLGGLFQVSLKQLQEIRGIGKVKAVHAWQNLQSAWCAAACRWSSLSAVNRSRWQRITASRCVFWRPSRCFCLYWMARMR